MSDKRFNFINDGVCWIIIDNIQRKQLSSVGDIVDLLNKLYDENDQLRKELFEARKDYLIETADISDKLFLEDEINELKKELFNDE